MTTVLIIEDERPLLENIQNLLRFEGYAVLGAADGLIGVDLAREHLPDLIVCDIMMPRMNGYDVLLELSSNPVTNTIPFIFLTAKADREHQRYGMELGADDYITKPFSRDEFLTAIRIRLERQRILHAQYQQEIESLRRALVLALPLDLRAPLTGVLGYAKKLISDAKTLQPAEISQIAQAILRASQRLHRQIENYLLFAQLEIIQLDPRRVIVLERNRVANPAEIITTKTHEKAAEYDREADVSLDVQPAIVQIGRNSLEKVVEETVDNALKYSACGTAVHVSALIEDDTYVLCVADEGPGMASDDLHVLTTPPRFDHRLQAPENLGLGLIILNHLIRAHDGELQIVTAPGQGTRIVARLKLSAENRGS